MLTIGQLAAAIQQLDPKLLDIPVRSVKRVHQVERGALEGALLLQSTPVVGMALSQEGLFMFIKEDGDESDNYMAGLPPGFQTGNPDIDNRLKGIEPGDEWKSQ